MKIQTSDKDLNETGVSVSQRDFYNSFSETGFPNKKNEDWKFTDLDKILSSNFDELIPFKDKAKTKPKKIFNFKHYSITTLNGELVESNLAIKGSAEEAERLLKKISNLKDHSIFFDTPYNLTPGRPILETNAKKDEMLSLNLSFLDRGYSFQILNDLDAPLVIYNFYDENLNGKMINNSNSIKVSNSKASIIEVNIDNSNTNFFKNTFQKYLINESEVNYYFINYKKSHSFNYTNNNIEINNSNSKQGSKFNYFIFGSGSKFRKDDFKISLNGENSFAKVNSAMILKEDEHQELKTEMFHKEPNCKSYQKIKNILTEKSKGIFQGKIYVTDRAQKTDAYQLSKGLILDDKAEFSAKPQLEIYADDVKCSHGSTSGNIDQDAIFYLMSRGLSKKEATKLIIKGFLKEVFSEINEENIKKLIEKHLEENI